MLGGQENKWQQRLHGRCQGSPNSASPRLSHETISVLGEQDPNRTELQQSLNQIHSIWRFWSLLPWLLRPACIPWDYNHFTADDARDCAQRCHCTSKVNPKVWREGHNGGVVLIHNNRLQCSEGATFLVRVVFNIFADLDCCYYYKKYLPGLHTHLSIIMNKPGRGIHNFTLRSKLQHFNVYFSLFKNE